MIHYQDHWAVVTGASSGLGRGLALRLAARGMNLILTGRSPARLQETAAQIRSATPAVQVETVIANLATPAGVAVLLAHVGERPVEVLVNNAGFGSYGPFAHADLAREAEGIAVDVGAVVQLARAFLPGMLARRSGGMLNVASTIAFQPGPYQAVYGASKAFVLSFSQALWAEARSAGVAVTALCPGPTRTGFVAALGADVSKAAIYRTLGEPGPVIDAGLRALDRGRAVVVPGLVNWLLASSSRFTPREWMARISARLIGPKPSPRPSVEVRTELLIDAPAERVWELLTDVDRWPSWFRACHWVRRPEPNRPASFRWKAHPVELQSTVVESERPRSFAFDARAFGLHARHAFTIAPRGGSTVVTSHETQHGPLPWLGRLYLTRHLRAANQALLADLARASAHHPTARAAA